MLQLLARESEQSEEPMCVSERILEFSYFQLFPIADIPLALSYFSSRFVLQFPVFASSTLSAFKVGMENDNFLDSSDS